MQKGDSLPFLSDAGGAMAWMGSGVPQQGEEAAWLITSGRGAAGNRRGGRRFSVQQGG